MNAEQLSLEQKFDYVVMSDLVGHLYDIQQALEKITIPNASFAAHHYLLQFYMGTDPASGGKISIENSTTASELGQHTRFT